MEILGICHDGKRRNKYQKGGRRVSYNFEGAETVLKQIPGMTVNCPRCSKEVNPEKVREEDGYSTSLRLKAVWLGCPYCRADLHKPIIDHPDILQKEAVAA